MCSVYNIVAAFSRIPSSNSIVQDINNFDLVTLCESSGQHELSVVLRVALKLAGSAQICSSPAFNAVDLTDEIESVSERRLYYNRPLAINGPLACNARVTPNGSSRSNGVEVFVCRNLQICGLCTPVCNVTGSVYTCEDDFLILRNIDVRFPEIVLTLNCGHTNTRPLCIFHIAISKSVNTNSCAVCFPPVLSYLAIEGFDSRRSFSACCIGIELNLI